MNVYLLFGSAGEYSDYREWVVAAYLDREQAEVHLAKVVSCLGEYQKLERRRQEVHGAEELEVVSKMKYLSSTFDPNVEIGLTELPKYNIEEVPFPRHYDEFLEMFSL